MKQVRITFRAEVYVEGETFAECKEKFESMNIFVPESKSRFIETVSIEDADTFKNIEEEWDMCDEDDGMAEGLIYLREHLAQDEIDEIRAQIDRSYRYHMNPSDCCAFNSRVEELLEEYGEDNYLPEGWWMYEGDIDDWLLKL